MKSANLARLRIASPCPASWEQMSGDEQVRHCKECELDVYNISALTSSEAEALLASKAGRLCARFYRRTDGTIITKDCPVGLRAVRRRMGKIAAAVFALVGSVSTIALGQPGKRTKKEGCVSQTKIARTVSKSSQQEALLEGTILDPAGALVPGAKITFIDASKKEFRSTTSDDAGQFQIAAIPAGIYRLTIESSGFMKHIVTNVSVKQKEALNIQVTLTFAESEALVGVVGYPGFYDPPGTTTITERMFRSLPH